MTVSLVQINHKGYFKGCWTCPHSKGYSIDDSQTHTNYGSAAGEAEKKKYGYVNGL